MGIVERSLNEPGAIADFVHDLDLNVISKDFDWRGVFENLVNLGSDYDDFKRVAMVKYMQYLAARQEIVRNTYSSRHAGKKLKTGVPEGDLKKGETLIFDLTSVATSGDNKGKFERLPKGESIEIPFDDYATVDLVLAKHKFSIVSGESFQFVDEKNHYSVLSPGKNIVGRDERSDVVIDANYRAVSRRHLIIETEGTSMVRLTDISSLGTFVPPEFLDRTGL